MYTIKDLTEAGKQGAERARDALLLLTKATVSISTTKVELKDYDEFLNSVEFSPVSFMIFSQTLKAPERNGVVLLALKEVEGRRLFHLLAGEDTSLPALKHELPVEGKSALSEVLNILSNSYINALSDKLSLRQIELDPPKESPEKQIFNLLKVLSEKQKIQLGSVVIFETLLHINAEETHARLVLLLDKKLLES